MAGQPASRTNTTDYIDQHVTHVDQSQVFSWQPFQMADPMESKLGLVSLVSVYCDKEGQQVPSAAQSRYLSKDDPALRYTSSVAGM